MSPPLPQPMSRTFPRPIRALGGPANGPETELFASTGWAKRVMRIDFTQLLKFLRPMMGDSRRWTIPTSGRELSGRTRK